MNSLWFFEDVNLFNILCPHKFKGYKGGHAFNEYRKNDYIYFEDAAADKVFLVNSGKVKIGYVTDDGDEIITSILSKGEIFGEKAILGQDNRNEFAQAIEKETSVCPITTPEMIDLLRDNKEFSLKIYKFIGFRFKKLERRLQLLLFKDTILERESGSYIAKPLYISQESDTFNYEIGLSSLFNFGENVLCKNHSFEDYKLVYLIENK